MNNIFYIGYLFKSTTEDFDRIRRMLHKEKEHIYNTVAQTPFPFFPAFLPPNVVPFKTCV